MRWKSLGRVDSDMWLNRFPMLQWVVYTFFIVSFIPSISSSTLLPCFLFTNDKKQRKKKKKMKKKKRANVLAYLNGPNSCPFGAFYLSFILLFIPFLLGAVSKRVQPTPFWLIEQHNGPSSSPPTIPQTNGSQANHCNGKNMTRMSVDSNHVHSYFCIIKSDDLITWQHRFWSQPSKEKNHSSSISYFLISFFLSFHLKKIIFGFSLWKMEISRAMNYSAAICQRFKKNNESILFRDLFPRFDNWRIW